MLKRLAQLLQDSQLSLFHADTESVAPRMAKAPGAADSPSAKSTRELSLGEHRVAYELRRARRRSIGFVVSTEGLRVSAPRWLPQADIERALLQKSDWILRKLVEQGERARRVEAARIEWREGGMLRYLGQPVWLRLDPNLTGVRLDETGALLLLGLPAQASEEQIRDLAQAWLKRRARAVFEPRCQHFAQALGVEMKHLRLSSAQTRWGSASVDGSIRLNWRLIHFSPAIIDYVVAHELAHLREMNHSARFWEVVRSVLPEFEQARSQLRDESIIAE
ncbi:M48 family metallopeptidase [Paucibacter sp. Y2R2-4]|uniref:M48 family metallopeptidase n=1 Tax=Paucibacter sp. Y2R2-4 TaxID=2893553 RepID=UPI0021E4254B|nr:SprT family zinc-dependent metalloprotease [Paucibacter sp. Y2R2-4]MCV2350185.1 M48 family metallopeptidase [Paucibacter sp. Y2R2-4]